MIQASSQGGNAPKTPCCKITCRDILMVGAEGAATAATVASFILTKNYWIAGLFAGVDVALFIVHGCWRRDATLADFHRSTEALGKTTVAVQKTAKKTEDTVQQLISAITETEKDKQAMLKAEDDLQTVQVESKTQVEKLTQEISRLTVLNQDLSKQVMTFKTQTQKLQESVVSINKHLTKFQETNASLKTDVGQLNDVIIELGKEDSDLKIDVEEMGTEIGKEISSLATQVNLTKRTGQELLTAIAQKINQLQEQIQALKSIENKVNLDEQNIRLRTEQLKQLEEKNKQAEKALEERKAEFQKIDEDLSKAQISLNETLLKLSQTDTKLSNNNSNLTKVSDALNQTAIHFDTLGDRFTHDIQLLNTISNETQEQKTEVDNL